MSTAVGTVAQAFGEAATGWARDKITASLIVAGVTLPVWHALLKTASENAALLAPLVFLGVAVLKFYNEWPKKPAANAPAKGKTIAEVISTAAKFKMAAMWFVTLVSVVAVFCFAWRSEAKASPASEPNAIVSTKKRKPADDDSGGEKTDEDAEAPSGHKLYDLARTFIGNTPEALPNGRANPKVKAMFAAVDGFNPATVDCRNVPWCSVFINFLCLSLNWPRTKNAMARSWLRWGQAVDAPKIGDVGVSWRGQYNDGETGHVWIFAGWSKRPGYVLALGGNQGDEVCIEEILVTGPRSRLLGFRRYRPLYKSKQMIGAAVKGSAAVGAGGLAVAEATSDPTPPATAIAEHIESVREPVSMVSEYLPDRWRVYAIIFCSVLGLAGAALVWYGRNKMRQETGA